MPDGLPPPILIANWPGLDFLNTVATPVDKPVEWIGDGKDFIRWLGQARLLTANDISAIESSFSKRELDHVAFRARELREWFREFVRTHKGKALSPRDLKKLGPLNELLGLDHVVWSIAARTASDQDKNASPSPLIFRLRPHRRWRTPQSLLALVAEELAKVVCSVDFQHIKSCGGKNCTLLFNDETRRRERRWCSMAICGNRAKQEAYRERLLKRQK